MPSKRRPSENFGGYDMDIAGFKLFGSRLASEKKSETKQLPSMNAIKPLENGALVKSKSCIYQIIGRIGKYGYRVERAGLPIKGQALTMHIEPAELPVDAPQLKRYVFFLQSLEVQRNENKKHFLKLEDRGQVPSQYNYLVTTSADLNLDDLRRNRLKAQFKPSTAMALSAQTLQAIHDVHLNHYIHRDIRPSNFLIGLPPTANVVYLLGFSLAYKYYPLRKTQNDAKAQTPRRLTKWRTVNCKFQSRSYHLGMSIARIDDIESWFYMCIDFFGQSLLPWDKTTSEKEIFRGKQRLFYDGCEQIYNVVPRNFRAIKNAINMTSRQDPVDYTLFADVILSCAVDIPYNMYGPFEWEILMKDNLDAKNAALARQETCDNNESKFVVKASNTQADIIDEDDTD